MSCSGCIICRRELGHHGENQRTGMLGVVVNICCLHEFRAGCGVLAGIQVAIEAREVTRRDFEAEPVAFEEDVACGPEVDSVLVDFARLDGLGLRGRVAVAGAENAVGEVEGCSIRRDVD